MARQEPTWADGVAEQEALYVHPLTRAALSLAERLEGDMPDAMPVPREQQEGQTAASGPQPAAGGRWRNAPLPVI
eukprot:5467683-Lingulodinium_polyedra.AAC.1